MVINTTIPLLDRTLPQLKTHRSYANQLQQSNWTHDVRRSFPNRFWPRNRWTSMDLEILYFVQDWYDDEHFARVMAPSRHLTWFGDGPVAQSYTCTRRVRRQNLEFLRKAHRMLQSWNRRTARAELRTEERFWFCELPDSPDSSCYAPSSNGSDEDDFDYGPFIDQANKRDQLPQTGSSTTTQSWATGSRSETNQSWQHFGEGHSQDLWNPSEYHNWRWLPEHKRIIHRRPMDTTSEQLWIRYFPAWVNEPENPFPTSTGAKQKQIHCSAMKAREIDDENADMDYHAVPPPEYQAGGDSKRENLCQQYSERVTWTTPRASSSGQLEAAGASSSGRLVATEDPSSEKKVHLHPNDDGRNTSGSSAILHTISSWRSTNFTIKYWTVHVQELVNIPPIFKISRSTLRFGAKLQATAYELHLGLQRITKTSKDLIQAVQRQVKTLIDRKDAHNKQILKDWNTFRWSRIMLLSDPAAELIRMKVHVSDSILCVGVSNPNPSNNWATKWQPEKCDSFGTYLQLLRPFKSRSILKKTWTCKLQNLLMRESFSYLCSTTLNGQWKAIQKPVCPTPSKWQHLRPNSSQDTGASCGPRQKRRRVTGNSNE